MNGPLTKLSPGLVHSLDHLNDVRRLREVPLRHPRSQLVGDSVHRFGNRPCDRRERVGIPAERYCVPDRVLEALGLERACVRFRDRSLAGRIESVIRWISSTPRERSYPYACSTVLLICFASAPWNASHTACAAARAPFMPSGWSWVTRVTSPAALSASSTG